MTTVSTTSSKSTGEKSLSFSPQRFFDKFILSILIRDLEPKLPENQEQREKLMRWIHLLVDPLTSAQDAELRVKRNRYLFMICSALMYGNESDVSF